MSAERAYRHLDAALRRSGAGWDAAQAHALIPAGLAVRGADAAWDFIARFLEQVAPYSAERHECELLLRAEVETTGRALAERLSGFSPLLPGDDEPAARRTEALAHWCEGFLHGLVSSERSAELEKRLAAEPIADIIRDMLEMTRAVADGADAREEEEQAYAEIVEYLRIAAQLVYEELADTPPAVSR
jgi:uncharacterized protein YgfB (UPF0149 family)